MVAGEDEADDILLKDFNRGDERAFKLLFREFYPSLCYFAERLLQDGYAAEEIAQDSLLKLWERHPNFSSRNAVKAFLYITVRNACLKSIRSSGRYQDHINTLSDFSDSHEDPAEFELIRTDVYHTIYQAILQLPPQCSKIVRMSYLEGLKNHEIAEKLEISEQTVKNQKVKAIKLMKNLLHKEAYLLLFLPFWH